MLSGEGNDVQNAWAREYGETFAIRSLLGVRESRNAWRRACVLMFVQTYQLITADTRAVTHILFASHIFQKDTNRRRMIIRFFGEGTKSFTVVIL